MPELGIGKESVFVERVLLDPGVFGVDVEDPVLELGQRCDVVDLLPDQVRWVEIQPEIRAIDLAKHPPPDGRAWSPGSCRRAIRRR